MGRAAVMREAVKAAADEARPAEPVQDELFALPTRLAGDAAAELQEAHRARSGPKGGRPPGAENLSTRQFREFLMRKGVSPLQSLMAWSMHTPETLARELGCSKLEAMRELRAMWGELAPYLHARVMPTDDKGQVAPILNIVMGGGAPAAGTPAGEAPPWSYLDVEKVSEINGSRPADDDGSHDRGSHGEAKGEADQSVGARQADD